ncbi:hypothetical protein GCM10011316_09290 [Roseibium aquae]|uniref:Methyltransferase FkbM domain-containing protein n=1 Tax=Roseibium aquae TaxID=1323746 RepID=A0A916TBZ3_9HYPH|nr:FkbM family methyltransferase [Roseibium aquae]GGB39395.1 hypothetical protein GCM10011316_09290 [Roseibium aquae]
MPSTGLSGLFRSFDVYYRDAGRRSAMEALYARFLRPGDLAFDIGSHVGDRVSAMRLLGAQVVAVEPQPMPYRALRLIHGRDRKVRLVQAACGEAYGEVELFVNSANPTVSTASPAFTQAASGAAGWEGQTWDRSVTVPLVCLDSLIERFGSPAFIKIDVEGYEPKVLAGLSRPVPALSFEFTLIQIDLVPSCLERLTALGFDRFNYALGESHRLAFERAVSSAVLLDAVMSLPASANSGDVYAWAPAAA